MDLEAARDRELALLDKIETRAWEGWERAERDGDSGAVRFAAVLLKTSKQRADLLGLLDNPPKPIVPNDPLKAERMDAMAKAYRAKVRRDVRRELELELKAAAPNGTVLASPVVTTVTIPQPAQ